MEYAQYFPFCRTVFDGLQPLLVPGTTCLHIELEVITDVTQYWNMWQNARTLSWGLKCFVESDSNWGNNPQA